jgi:acyl carrier protein phosphodiesterase
MISDFVKGKKQYDYPLPIQAGIQLHRAIDTFTDTHASTQKIKEFFRADYRLYAGALTDVVYDYFLANDKSIFKNDTALKDFTIHTYLLLKQNKDRFGEKFGQMFPYMQTHNWLYNYQFDWGIQKSFEGVKRRAAYISETTTAFSIFIEHKNEMKQHYDDFFISVKNFAADTFAQLLKK